MAACVQLELAVLHPGIAAAAAAGEDSSILAGAAVDSKLTVEKMAAVVAAAADVLAEEYVAIQLLEVPGYILAAVGSIRNRSSRLEAHTQQQLGERSQSVD